MEEIAGSTAGIRMRSLAMQTTNKPLARQIAIVTGAGRGIGKAIACAYAEAGAAVACVSRTEAEVRQTAQQIVSCGGKALPLQADVSQRPAVEGMIKATVETFGGLDILVINAGVSGDSRRIEDSDPETWKNVIEANLFGAYYCARAAIPAFKERGAGKIITIGSGGGHNGKIGASSYACSKAGLWMLTRVLAQEVWQYNISVNELIPGPVVTSLTTDSAAGGKGVFGLESEWVKTPADVVPLAMFLATQPVKGPTAESYSLMRRDG